MNGNDLALGAVASAVIALVALRARALTPLGAAAAFVVGGLTFGAGSLGGAIVLLTFFITSTLLSRAGKARKRELVDAGKAGPRDEWQVLANGGIATVCVVAWSLLGHGDPLSPWFAAFAGAYGAATADTWGTEIGTLAAQAPRSILSRKPVAAGLSGGVTRAGTAAEIVGAASIAAVTPVALILALPAGAHLVLHGRFGFELHDLRTALTLFFAVLVAAVFAGGVVGALADSVLGELAQERRWCPRCERECETNPHVCGTPTSLRRGLPWLGNDGVNAVATLTGALVAAAIFHFTAG